MNFTIKAENPKTKEPIHYEYEREHKKEMRRIEAVEKELKHHEQLGMAKAHPQRPKS